MKDLRKISDSLQKILRALGIREDGRDRTERKYQDLFNLKFPLKRRVGYKRPFILFVNLHNFLVSAQKYIRAIS